MENINNNQLMVFLGLILIALEVLLGAPTGFDLLLVGVILVIGGGVGTLTGSFMIALGTVILLSFLYVLFGRKVLKSKLNVTTQKTNTDNLMGQTAVVTKAITPSHPGQIKVEGEIWRAESDIAVEVGKKVIIESVSGVTLKVKQ